MGFFRTASRKISDTAQGFSTAVTRRVPADTCEQVKTCINSSPTRETLQGIKNGLIEGGLSGMAGGLAIGLTLTVMMARDMTVDPAVDKGEVEAVVFPIVCAWLMFTGLKLGLPVGATFNGLYGLCDGLSQKYFSKPLIRFNDAVTDLAVGCVKGLGFAMGTYYTYFYFNAPARPAEDSLLLAIPMALGGAGANTIYTAVRTCRSRMFNQPSVQGAAAEEKEMKEGEYRLMKDPVDLEMGMTAGPTPPM